MFNLIKDEFDENSEDILASINKMLDKNKKNIDSKENSKEDSKED